MRIRTLSADAHDVVLDAAVVEARRVGGRWVLDGQVAPNVVVSGAQVTVFAQYGISFDIIDLTGHRFQSALSLSKDIGQYLLMGQ